MFSIASHARSTGVTGQFDAIHPFDDGNGRTGRILNLLFLVDASIARVNANDCMMNATAERARELEGLRQ